MIQKSMKSAFDFTEGEHAGIYTDTPIPPAPEGRGPSQEDVPEEITQMTALFERKIFDRDEKIRNFIRQGTFMKDYEDDAPWYGPVNPFYSVYHDFRAEQLRGYFTWRTQLRRGIWQETHVPFVKLYINELLNRIGVDCAQEGMEKLLELNRNYLGAGFAQELQSDLDRYMFQYALYWQLDMSGLNPGISPERALSEQAVFTLEQEGMKETGDAQNPDEEAADRFLQAAEALTHRNLLKSPAFQRPEHRMLALRIWRRLFSESAAGQLNTDFREYCFGTQIRRKIELFSGAVFKDCVMQEDRTVFVTALTGYHCKQQIWYRESRIRAEEEQKHFDTVLREIERQIRQCFGLGKPLKQRVLPTQLRSCMEQTIREYLTEQEEKRHPKPKINRSLLQKIREDAADTREKLLTEQERGEDQVQAFQRRGDISGNPSDENREEHRKAYEIMPEETEKPASAPAPLRSGLLPDPVYDEILLALLAGKDTAGILSEHHLMASLVCDSMNEALYDLIGDNALETDGKQIFVVEEYLEDLRESVLQA